METSGVANKVLSSSKGWQFGIRSMFAHTAGIAFIALVIRWAFYLGALAWFIVFLIIPWAVTSLAGVVVMRRLGRNPVFGGALGGACVPVVLALITMIGQQRLLPWTIGQLVFLFALTMCGGLIYAGILDIIEEGV